MKDPFSAVSWEEGKVRILDQKLLPQKEFHNDYDDWRDVARAIKDMEVRGAPAIGITAAYGIALWAKNASDKEMSQNVEEVFQVFHNTRPTAVNLFWALGEARAVLESTRSSGPEATRNALLEKAKQIHKDDIASCHQIGRLGLSLIPKNARVLTHCNAGGLATGGYGTALAPIRTAHEEGLGVKVFADETRPYLQGARLTAWELQKVGVPVDLLTDNMAGYFFSKGEIDLVIVGADRIAGNGDVANKIGTYTLAILADAHNIPFYVAAPTSTIDRTISSGKEIPIEERSSEEVVQVGGVRVAPEGVTARHPAFDVTPARLIRAIITEKGLASPPNKDSIAKLF